MVVNLAVTTQFPKKDQDIPVIRVCQENFLIDHTTDPGYRNLKNPGSKSLSNHGHRNLKNHGTTTHGNQFLQTLGTINL